MASAKINKEILEYKETIFFGLTMRQFICAILAAAGAVAVYFLFRDIVGKEAVSWLCIFTAAPFAFMGFFSYNGLTAEKLLIAVIYTKVNSGLRVYKCENHYLKALELSKRKGRKYGKNSKKQSQK